MQINFEIVLEPSGQWFWIALGASGKIYFLPATSRIAAGIIKTGFRRTLPAT